MLVQTFALELVVESVNKGVLIGFTSLNVSSLLIVLLTPVDQRLSGQLRAVVNPLCSFDTQQLGLAPAS